MKNKLKIVELKIMIKEFLRNVFSLEDEAFMTETNNRILRLEVETIIFAAILGVMIPIFYNMLSNSIEDKFKSHQQKTDMQYEDVLKELNYSKKELHQEMELLRKDIIIEIQKSKKK